MIRSLVTLVFVTAACHDAPLSPTTNETSTPVAHNSNPPSCAASFATTAVGQTCESAVCDYPEGRCFCSTGSMQQGMAGGTLQTFSAWVCRSRTAADYDCPVEAPHGACTHDGLSCSYSQGCANTYTCTAQAWKETAHACPPAAPPH